MSARRLPTSLPRLISTSGSSTTAAQYANRERFPRARRILVGPIEEILPTLEITPLCYALIVTRGHGHDQEALYQLAPTAAGYVGLIGSRRKIRLDLRQPA